jgi:hypothetical protein
MEGFPGLVDTERLPLEIPVRPCLKDHCFDGRIVLPAVEAMELLSRAAGHLQPGDAPAVMTGLRFDKFLAISPGAESLSAFCELGRLENGDVRAVLATRIEARKAALTRVKEHAAVVFHRPGAVQPDPEPRPVFTPEAGCFSVTSARIYPELIPFGPFYRNVVDLRIGSRAALAEIRTPVEDSAAVSANRLGSPFALDAAFHAACVWGQRFAGIVAFPVAMDRRRIHRCTRAGETYCVHVTPVRADSGILVFDLQITDHDGSLYESCSGIRMRDVSGGRLKPPQWIRTHPRR